MILESLGVSILHKSLPIILLLVKGIMPLKETYDRQGQATHLCDSSDIQIGYSYEHWLLTFQKYILQKEID